MDTYRCFIALDLPEHVKRDLSDIQKEFVSWPVRVKWSRLTGSGPEYSCLGSFILQEHF